MDVAIEKNNEAVKFFLNENFKEAELKYKAALMDDENNTTVLNNLGLLYHQQKNFDEAEKYFEKAITLNSKDVYHVNLANTYVFRKKNKLAHKHYQAALDQNPSNENAKVGLAKLYVVYKDFSSADDLWRNLIQSTHRFIYMVNYAQSLVAQKKFEQTLEFLYSINIKEDSSAKWHLIGVCEFSLKNYGLAETAFKKGLALEPDQVNIRQHLATNFLAKGDTESAIKQFDQVIVMQPENYAALTNKGVILLGNGQLKESLKIFKKALKIKPNFEKAIAYKNRVTSMLEKNDGE